MNATLEDMTFSDSTDCANVQTLTKVKSHQGTA